MTLNEKIELIVLLLQQVVEDLHNIKKEIVECHSKNKDHVVDEIYEDIGKLKEKLKGKEVEPSKNLCEELQENLTNLKELITKKQNEKGVTLRELMTTEHKEIVISSQAIKFMLPKPPLI